MRFPSPQHVVHPNDVALMRGFVVDGDGGCGLDPQVASPPLKPTVVPGHHLTFPQHLGGGGGGRKGIRTRTQETIVSLGLQFTVVSAEGADNNGKE